MRKLKAYMFHSGFPEEGAVLTFAYSHKEAKKLSFREINLDEWLELRGRLIKDDFIFELGNKEKIIKGIPHCIDCPESCKMCELWGVSRLNKKGYCENCESCYGVAGNETNN